MPRLLIVILALAVAGTANAGVHNLAEAHPRLQSLDQTRGYYLDMRSVGLPTKGRLDPESTKAMVLRQVAYLEEQKARGTFTTEDLVSLSGAYLRLGPDKIGAARRLLLAGDQSHFLVQSNLAAAYFLSDELAMAVRHQTKCLEAWPEVFAGWSDQYLRGTRELERYLLTLYRLRAEEQHRRAEEKRRGSKRDEVVVEVDALFPGVRYVAASGQYEAGAIAAAYRDRMPQNAFDIVYRLCLWFPMDMRLYWQLGELYNVAGWIDQAHGVFVELVDAGMARSFKDLAKHRRVLIDAKPIYTTFRDPKARSVFLTQLLVLGRPPIGGDAFYLGGCATAVSACFWQEARDQFGGIEAPTGPPPAQPREVFNFTHVAAGFGFGFVVASLCALQWQEWRRRRLQTVPSREEREPVPLSPPERSTSITPGG